MSREAPAADQFASMIEGLRAAGMTYREIAERSHVSHGTVWRAANGMAKEPLYSTYTKIERLAEKLGALPKHGR